MKFKEYIPLIIVILVLWIIQIIIISLTDEPFLMPGQIGF